MFVLYEYFPQQITSSEYETEQQARAAMARSKAKLAEIELNGELVAWLRRNWTPE